MRRRDFIAGLAGAAVGPVTARAQQGGLLRRIGVLMAYPESDSEAQSHIAMFRERLRKLGWEEGRSIRIDMRWAKPDDRESIQRFAKELVALQPDLVLSTTTPTTAALLQQTRVIPIVFVNIADPVGSGFVASFPRPGGNATGFITMEPTMATTWVGLLKEIVPSVKRVALLFNPATATYADYYIKPFNAAAAALAAEAIAARVHAASEIESVIAAQARTPDGGLVVMPDSFLNAHREEITSLAARSHGSVTQIKWPPTNPGRFIYHLSGEEDDLSRGLGREQRSILLAMAAHDMGKRWSRMALQQAAWGSQPGTRPDQLMRHPKNSRPHKNVNWWWHEGQYSGRRYEGNFTRALQTLERRNLIVSRRANGCHTTWFLTEDGMLYAAEDLKVVP